MSTTALPDWTPEQRAVLEHSGSALAVLAGAGAGKTSVLVEKCRRLLSSRPDARICAVSFTEKSASDLRLKLSQFDLSRHWVTTIHGLCGMILREFPDAVELQGDERVLSEPEASRIWKEALESLWFDDRGPGEPEVAALQRLLAREGRSGLEPLLLRTRELAASGLFDSIRNTSGSESGDDFGALVLTARRVLEAYARAKRAAGVLDFSDLESLASQAMKLARVREPLRRRFDLVLVDEFQDTNSIQASILWSLARPDLSNLCVVGDPKQSIYRFRDADVSLFEELCHSLPKQLSLTSNFRSRPGILDFVNRICPPLFEASGLSYLPLVPGRKDLGQASGPVVSRLDLEDASGLARHLIEQNSRGVPWERMAILMRKIKGNERWIHALSRHGIPLAVGGGGLFWKDPRIVELLALLRWWAHPADEVAGVSFMRAPWVGVSDHELDAWLSSPGRLHQFWDSENPVALALASFRDAAAAPIRPAQLIERLLAVPELAGALATLRPSALSLMHRLEELSQAGLCFGEVIASVREGLEGGRRDKDVPPPRNRGVLPVLTIHASKGLEFDHVYLVDFGKKGRAPTPPLLFWDRRRGAFLVDRDAEGDRLDDDPRYLEWKAWEQEAAVAEGKRLFYVALTRARESLVLACEAIDSAKAVTDDPALAARGEHWRAWLEHFGGPLAVTLPSSGRAQPPRIGPVASTRAPARLPEIGTERARHAVTEWALLSRCERAYVRSVLGAAPQDQEPAGLEIERHAGRLQLSAVELGKRVHALLEAWAQFPDHRVQITQKMLEFEAEAPVKGRFRARLLLEWLEKSAWLEGEGISEWPFEWRIGGTSLVGAIDRLSCSGRVLTVLDYKVFSALKDPSSVRELYGPQLELYAGAVDAFLQQGRQADGNGSDWKIEARVVQITPEGIEEVEIPLDIPALRLRAPDFARRAGELVQFPEQGESRPTVRESCRFCPHRDACDALSAR